MNWLINILSSKVAAPVWAALDGKKLYGTGALAILGAAVGLGSELAPLLAAHNTAGLIAFVSHINSDPSYIALLAGLGTIGAAHKAQKIEAAAASPTV